jgi:hypothetical protein
VPTFKKTTQTSQVKNIIKLLSFYKNRNNPNPKLADRNNEEQGQG